MFTQLVADKNRPLCSKDLLVLGCSVERFRYRKT